MSMNIQRVIIIQDASNALSTNVVRQVVLGLSLKAGDKLKLLGVIQAFSANCRLNQKRCFLLKKKTKLHSSRTISKHKKDIEEEKEKKTNQYLSCPEFNEIVKLTETLQVEFEIAMEAGSLKEVAVEYSKSYQATHVVLHSQLKKEKKYFMQNLSCAISRIKRDATIEVMKPFQADEISIIQEANSHSDYKEWWKDPSKTWTCSLCMNKRPIGNLKKFTYAELQLATSGFSPQNLMPDHGKNIYLGRLNDQRSTLVREHPSTTIKEDAFRREVQILERIGHENVTLLLGYCCEGPKRFLVYEYICNGSLNKHLSDKELKLTWETRINIVFGAAKGLQHLHRKKIYGSMRPSNILITHDCQPFTILINFSYMNQISYYGLATNQYEALGQSSGTTVLKTFEYLSPEYEETGIDMSKADVYSFGVVILELITGRKTINDTNGQSFLRWARPLLRQKKYMELLDCEVQETVDLYQLYWLVRVADRCLRWDPKTRYSMNKVVQAMLGIINRSGVEDFSPEF